MNAFRRAQTEIATQLSSVADAEPGWDMAWLKRAAAGPLLVAAVAVSGLTASQPAHAFDAASLVMSGIQKLATDPNAQKQLKEALTTAASTARSGSIAADGRVILDKAREGAVDLETVRLQNEPVDAKRKADFKQNARLLAAAITQNAGAMTTFYVAASDGGTPKADLKAMHQQFNTDRDALAEVLGAYANARKDLQKAGVSTVKEDQLVTAALTQYTPAVTKVEKMDFDRVAFSAAGADEMKDKLRENAKKAGGFLKGLLQQGADKANPAGMQP